jgi:hypothetical protein
MMKASDIINGRGSHRNVRIDVRTLLVFLETTSASEDRSFEQVTDTYDSNIATTASPFTLEIFNCPLTFRQRGP